MDISRHQDREILLIRLGPKTFGLRVADVQRIAPLPDDLGNSGSGAREYFVQDGEPLPYVPLWGALGMGSAYAEYEEMEAMLPQRRQDHLDWMGALEDSIRNGTPFTKARSPRECAFGKWFYNYRADDRRLKVLLLQFEHPHAIIHGLADRLLGLVESGQRAEAWQAFEEAKSSTLARLLTLFEETRTLVRELQRRIGVVVADSAGPCTLGADGVIGIVQAGKDQIKGGTGKSSGAIEGLLVRDDATVVPLIDWRALSSTHRPCQG